MFGQTAFTSGRQKMGQNKKDSKLFKGKKQIVTKKSSKAKQEELQDPNSFASDEVSE